MSKESACAAAVGAQLNHEGRWPPNDLNKIMGDDYHYDGLTLRNFLVAVKWNLEHGEPPYLFEFDDAFVRDALGKTVAELVGAVIGATR